MRTLQVCGASVSQSIGAGKHPLNLLNKPEKPKDTFDIFCDNLIINEKIYDPAEKKDRLKYALPILYDRLIGVVNYFLKLIVTDEIIKSISEYRRNGNELERIKQFVVTFGEDIYDYEYLAKMDYILRVYKKFCKAEGEAYGVRMFDQENRYCDTLKGLEMCKFTDLFFGREKYKPVFQSFYDDCHSSCGEEELNLYRANLRVLDVNLSSRN
ncbi:11684_t:CDS:2 [Scutellospora calospora]|uniref:11684_t:CDS:1 n=1 Tax=Scutellospora calospora TaxID=85575 RepID=A0ACA9LFX9_9GLOM|nr:11684_t:CDS:2 [Scutellospora calospora]